MGAVTDKSKEETLRRKSVRNEKKVTGAPTNNYVAKHMNTYNKPQTYESRKRRLKEEDGLEEMEDIVRGREDWRDT